MCPALPSSGFPSLLLPPSGSDFRPAVMPCVSGSAFIRNFQRYLRPSGFAFRGRSFVSGAAFIRNFQLAFTRRRPALLSDRRSCLCVWLCLHPEFQASYQRPSGSAFRQAVVCVPLGLHPDFLRSVCYWPWGSALCFQTRCHCIFSCHSIPANIITQDPFRRLLQFNSEPHEGALGSLRFCPLGKVQLEPQDALRRAF